MRLLAIPALLLLPSVSFAQNKGIQDRIDQKLAAIRYVQSLQTNTGGFLASVPAPNVRMIPTLRATSAAVRTLKYLTGKPVKEAVLNADKTAAFVLSCFDPKTGGFADGPGRETDVFTTAVGVMAAVELDIPKEKYRKAMDYLKENAKTFEDVRIGAAAVEAWGVKECPFELNTWFTIAAKFGRSIRMDEESPSAKNGGARDLASVTALFIRLGQRFKPAREGTKSIADEINEGQRDDGGWGKKDDKASDLETTYRVMRALMLLKAKPDDMAKLRAFIAKCRNDDGGWGVKPGDPSGVGPVYYATIVTKWLDEMEK